VVFVTQSLRHSVSSSLSLFVPQSLRLSVSSSLSLFVSPSPFLPFSLSSRASCVMCREPSILTPHSSLLLLRVLKYINPQGDLMISESIERHIGGKIEIICEF
jgi:hypothetical protein